MAESVVTEPRAEPRAADAENGRQGTGTAGLATLDGHAAGLRVIDAPSPGVRKWLAEFWRFRSAFAYYLIAYLRKRYGRTFLGYIWLVLPIVLPLLLSSLVFGGILGVQVPNGIPYFLYFTITSAIWIVFAGTAYYATRSLEITRTNLRKTYLPRLVPLSAAFSISLLNFAIYAVIGTGTVVYYVLAKNKFYLDLRPATLLAPVAVAMLIVFALAVGLWFSPLAPRARDVRRLAGYVIGMWYMITPIIWPIEKIPSSYRFLAELNPVTAPVELFKSSLIGVGDVTATSLIAWAVGLVVAASLGLRLFLSKERRDVAWYY
jgi:lipopolysaccharide transport system permease protein